MATVNKREPTEEEKRKIWDAAATGDVNAIQALATSGVDVTGSLNVYNYTALHSAARYGHYNVVAYLLSHGARVNDVDSDNRTALLIAAIWGHYNVVAYLLSHGARVNDVDSYDQWTPLHWVAFSGHAEIADLLVKNGASISMKDRENRTPLQVAVERGKSDVVMNFVKQQKMDITQFDDETQQEINELVKRAEKKQGQNTKNEAKLRILHSLSKAREDGCLIKVRYGKVLICGASEAGKTNFLNLLMEDEFQAKHISTGVGEPKRTIAMKAQVSESSQKIVFTKLEIDQEIDLLKLYLPEKYIKQSHSTQDDMSDVQKKSTFVEHVISEKVVENIDSEQETLPTQPLTDSEKILPTQQPTNLEKVWDILTFMDTGGQPQFISMLPAINNFAMITFIVHKLTEFLDKNVVAKHRDKDGKDSCVPYACEYKHQQLIKTLMSYASTVFSPDKEFLNKYKIKIDNKDKSTSSVSFIGTHSTSIKETDIEKIDKELYEMVRVARVDNVKLNSKYKCLAPIDNETQEKDLIKADTNYKKYTDPSNIREYIYKWLVKQDTYYVPYQWLLLELEIRKICIDRNCKFITYNEVLKLSQANDLGEEDFIQDGLRFHHLFGVLLYFDEVEELRELIIVDHQWLFNKLSTIVLYSFKSDHNYNPRTYCEDCEEKGIFKETMLDKLDVSKDFVKSEINIETIDPKKWLLDLLQHLKIIAPLKGDHPTQYFMPSLLYSCNLTDLEQNIPGTNKFVNDANEEIDAEPFLVQLRSPDNSYTFPRGFFCFLVVQIMHFKKMWEIDGQAYDNLLSFLAKDIDCYVTIIDRISCLEVQVTHDDIILCDGIFITVRDAIIDAFDEVASRLNVKVELKFGFWCKKCQNPIKHISVLEGYLSCYCSYRKATRLQRSHMIWFVKTLKSLSVMEGDHLKATPSMKQLQEVTRKTNFAARWEELGTYLEVGCNIPVIKKDNSNDSRGGCHKLFDTWLAMDTNASWDKLVSALRNIGMDADAHVVSEYCKSAYMKCSDRVPKASCSIQKPELQIIKDFLKSVDLRFDKSQPSLVTPKLPPVEPQPLLLPPELPPVKPQLSLLAPKLPPVEPELPLAAVEPLPKTSFVADENAPVESSLLAPELPLVEPELRPVKPLPRTNIVADENAKLQEKPAHKMLSRITSFLTDHWRKIAYELLQPQDVKSIESTINSNDDRCLDVLIKWLETDPSASYSKLIEALNELDLSCAADNVKKKILNNY